MSVHDSERMSGGPQVFLGATTFCVTCRQISGCREEHLLVPVCLVCPWAAARPLAVRAASFARRVVSKPGQALPPPTGTAAWPSGSLRTGAGGVFYTKPFGGVSPTCRTLA